MKLRKMKRKAYSGRVVTLRLPAEVLAHLSANEMSTILKAYVVRFKKDHK